MIIEAQGSVGVKRGAALGASLFLLGGLGVAIAEETVELQEITVTAQKREQSLSDVSLSVSAVAADTLVTTQTNSIESLQFLVPSISFGNDFNFAKLFIRGIGLNSWFPGADPSVALHVDGAVIAQAGAQMSTMFDLERVEVLRGPQGTLYGRNATGGAVNLITAKPSAALDGYARFTLGGSDVNTLAEGAVGGPLSEQPAGAPGSTVSQPRRLRGQRDDRERYRQCPAVLHSPQRAVPRR